MTDRIEIFEVDEPGNLRLRIASGSVRIVAGEQGRVTVRLSSSGRTAEEYRVEQQGDTVVVEPPEGRPRRWSSVAIVVETSEGLGVRARMGSGDLTALVPLSMLSSDTASGDLRVGTVTGDVTLKAAAGDLRVDEIGGALDATVASGDIRIGRVTGDARARAASGDIRLREAAGDVTVKTAAGDVLVGTFSGTKFSAKTLAGDVTVGVTSGKSFEVSFSSMSGKVRTDFPVGEASGGAASLEVGTMSGDITVKAAPAGN